MTSSDATAATRTPLRPLSDGLAMRVAVVGLGSGLAWLLFARGPFAWFPAGGRVPSGLLAACFVAFGLLFLVRLRTRRVLSGATKSAAGLLLLVVGVELLTAWDRGATSFERILPALLTLLVLWLWLALGGSRRAPFQRPRRITRRDIWRAVAR